MIYTAQIETPLGTKTVSVTDAMIDTLPEQSLARILRDLMRNQAEVSEPQIAAQYHREQA